MAKVNTIVRKYFPLYDGWYEGKVTKYDAETKLYFVQYDDGDSEEMDNQELKRYKKRKQTSSQQTPKRQVKPINTALHTQGHYDKTESDESQPTKSKKFCLLCRIHGRTNIESNPLDDNITVTKTERDVKPKDPTIFHHGGGQFLPVLLPRGQHKKRKGSDQMVTIGHVRASCLLRGPPTSRMNNPPNWWTEASELTHGYPSILKRPDKLDSTKPGFVPYYMGLDEWMNEFATYNYRMLLGSVRRFDDGRGPPYNFVGSTAACWRSDDRGSIGYLRMVQNLTNRASSIPDPSQRLIPAEAALWGAIVYRCFNRLSLFTRWTALKAVAALNGTDKPGSISSSENLKAYELAVYGEENKKEKEGIADKYDLRAIACSGVTLLGRNGIRDKWGEDFCREQMSLGSKAKLAVGTLPLPSEWEDFESFGDWEKYDNSRGVMTGEHQVQAYQTVKAMIRKLVANNCCKLRAMSRTIMGAKTADVALNELKELDTIADFFSWQIFSDLAAAQFFRQLYPDGTILPVQVVEDSRIRYGLYGPGARKGAHMIFGHAHDQLAYDKSVTQPSTIPRAAKIRAEFSEALKRTGLEGAWRNASKGREYDLETVEHSLCGFYGVLHNLAVNVLLADDQAFPLVQEAAKKKGCIWPPGGVSPSSDPSSDTKGKCIEQRQGASSSWRPHPSTDLERQDLLERCRSFANGNPKNGYSIETITKMCKIE